MSNLIYIFIGGGIGSILRYLISINTQKLWKIDNFPLGTLLVNTLGCFMIGIFTSYLVKNDDNLKYFFITGLCGGFTTFSTFSIFITCNIRKCKFCYHNKLLFFFWTKSKIVKLQSTILRLPSVSKITFSKLTIFSISTENSSTQSSHFLRHSFGKHAPFPNNTRRNLK